MAVQGGAGFLEKVSRMLSKENKRPVLKPNRPLVLKDTVANRKMKKGEATCITEMTLMMACWKLNNFNEALCSNETQAFYTCVRACQAAMTAKTDHASIEKKSLNPKQATALLKRFPNITTSL